MKKYIHIFLVSALLAAACTNETATIAETVEPDLQDQLSAFLATRSEEPLDQTIWVCPTDGEYDRYLLFKDGQISLFYGKIEDGALERWSDFYSASYTLYKGYIFTYLTYPFWGERNNTQELTVVRSDGAFSITAGNDVYTYYGKYDESLEEMWMMLIANIAPLLPWSENI